MARLTPEQERNRARVETLIRLGAPLFDVVLAVGERISRAVDRERLDWSPPRPLGESEGQRAIGPGPDARA